MTARRTGNFERELDDQIEELIKEINQTQTDYLPLTGGTLTGNLTAPGFIGPLTGGLSGGASDTIRSSNTNNVSLASTDHSLQIGAGTGINLAVDNNDIQCRDNGAASVLQLNRLGGNVAIGTAGGLGALLINGFTAWHNGNFPFDVVVLQDQKAQNTDGGTFTAGAWQTRSLTTVVKDTGSICSLASNQFTIPAGTYLIYARLPAYAVNSHQAYLYNTNASTAISGCISGTELASASDSSTNSIVMFSAFTLSVQRTLEIRHRCQTSKATTGWGVAANFTTEIYTTVVLIRIA